MASLKRLLRAVKRQIVGPHRYGITPLQPNVLQNADALVTTSELTDRHGTGVILSRIFAGYPNLLSIRSTTLYGGHSFRAENLLLSQQDCSREECAARVLYALGGNSVGRVLCVPFLPDELLSSLELRKQFGAPICTFIMDDNNVYSRGIPDELMREALSQSALRLAISPEMRDVYQQKFGFNFWVVPPVVSQTAINTTATPGSGPNYSSKTGILVGNIWSSIWLQRLRQAIRGSGLTVHWYGNSRASWLKVRSEDLRADGIIDCGFLPEEQLSVKLSQYPYALIPSGSLDERDDRHEIARLSLPSRMPYLLAVGNTPMLVLGSPQTAAAHFTRRFRVGTSVPYDGQKLRAAVEDLCQPELQVELRRNAARQSSVFSAADVAQWIWESLERREPFDQRFEAAFSKDARDVWK